MYIYLYIIIYIYNSLSLSHTHTHTHTHTAKDSISIVYIEYCWVVGGGDGITVVTYPGLTHLLNPRHNTPLRSLKM